jgi:Na+/H+-dicarboxylate symporter
MSSAASIPLTLIGTEKNAKNKDLVHTVVPATVNIHLIGDCIAIPCFAFAILKNFDLPQPDLMTYFMFTIYFVIAKFSVAAIPGGGIIVMLPILEQYLGFNSNMLSLITALYILFDPIITSANVFGNGAFAKMIDIVAPQKSTNK